MSIIRTTFWESAHMMLVLLAALGGSLAAHKWGPAMGMPKDLQPLFMVVGAFVGATCMGGWQRAVNLKELLPSK
ncbi:hypothetical protein [Streptomyces incarnatus]|uniref:hypothetical protein n=1 Tax=Streptomyces incarnatus TaxID=665007 RepID=UPI001AD7EF29|nr:hypothetical protein [Streptomyces incarnatus]